MRISGAIQQRVPLAAGFFGPPCVRVIITLAAALAAADSREINPEVAGPDGDAGVDGSCGDSLCSIS